MVGMNLGLGLGLSSSNPPSNPLCDAISKMLMVTATKGDVLLKLAPHVVFTRGRQNEATVDAVAVERDGKVVRNPRLRRYKVEELSAIALTGDHFTAWPDFFPDDAAYAGRTVCVVQTT